MAGEQQVNASGVQTPPSTSGNGTAATPQPEAQQPTQQTQTQTHAPAQATTDDNFRKWQSERDAERARLQAEAETARRDATRAREDAQRATRQAEEARLAGADPEEQVKFYRQQAEQAERQRQQDQVQAEEQRRFSAKAIGALQKAGIDPNDARLTPYLAGDSWAERFAGLSEGIAAIQSEEIQKMKDEIAKAEKRGAQSALVEAGVTQVSGAPSAPTDAKQAKTEEYRKKRNALRRSGRLEDAVRLETQAEREGISL